jgi:hypothetical protein
MIRVQLYAPPNDYVRRVKTPGERFLARNPHPTTAQFKPHSYWQLIHNDLYNIYNGICSYCASWTPRHASLTDPNYTSIDHFIPKSIDHRLAYEWSNYRLCRARLNSKKDNSLEIIDPFYVQNGWFIVDFTTFLILPNPNLPLYLFDRVYLSITILGLNDNDFVEQRLDVIYKYSINSVSMNDLIDTYPLIAEEMTRQGFDANFKEDIKKLVP